MRVTIYLDQQERDALSNLAQRERRDPRDQAALIIRHELQRAGLLPADTSTAQPQQPQAARHD